MLFLYCVMGCVHLHYYCMFYLYSVGGYDGTSFLSSMECYDSSSNQWNLLAPMACRRSEFDDFVCDFPISGVFH